MDPQCEVRNKKRDKIKRNKEHPYKHLGRSRTMNLERHDTKVLKK